MRANVYTRPNKPLTCKTPNFGIKVPLLAGEVKKPIMLTVDCSTECHTTPDHIAEWMANQIDYQAGQSICDPHAGTGQLISALINSGIDIHFIKAIELNHSLCEFTRNRFTTLSIEQNDFLNTFEKYDRIICNPPFKGINKHINHAVDRLNQNGVIVAIVPINYKKILHETLRTLPSDTFAHCKVNTKIIRITKII
jgi:phospholipid N-methyltransferase